MKKQNSLKFYGMHFNSLGLNITCINNYRNEFNLLERNLLKSPSHEWHSLYKRRQTLEEISSYDWDNALGIGIVLGFNNILAIDIDGSVENDFLNWICSRLEISSKYEWLIKSGSGSGFHIVLRCNNRPLDEFRDTGIISLHKFKRIIESGEVNAFYPTNSIRRCDPSYFNTAPIEHIFNLKKFGYDDLFQKIEFRWKNHLVLPPSLHESGLRYKFLNNIPENLPILIDFEKIKNLRNKICSSTAEFSGWGKTTNQNIAYEDEISIIKAEQKYQSQYEPKYLAFGIVVKDDQIISQVEKNKSDNCIEITQLAWCIVDSGKHIIDQKNFILKPYLDRVQNLEFEKSIDIVDEIGQDVSAALETFMDDINKVEYLVCHNYVYNSKIIQMNLEKFGYNPKPFILKPHVCTMYDAPYSNVPLSNADYRNLKLHELYSVIFSKELSMINNAIYLALITKICFQRLSYYEIKR
jgi:hypothetical protein